MNRTIKFRVWNNKTKKWIHGPNEHPRLDGVNLFGECILLGEFMQVPLEELNDCVALQFTGLKNENGKEIFEGDVINTKPARYKVIFKDGKFMAKFLMGMTGKDYFDLCDIAGHAIIIGNIFENPELLA